MKDIQCFAVAGLALGDEGKGSIVDFLARETRAAAVVRHGGGPQAAHYVETDDGRGHCFSQLGSGMFCPGVSSHLSRGMLIKLSNLLTEVDAILQAGATNILPRLSMDPEAYMVTPCHQLLTRVKEVARGRRRHGSVGMGVGEAARDRASDPEALRLIDLLDSAALERKLSKHWDGKLLEAGEIVRMQRSAAAKRTFEECLQHMNREETFSFYREFGEKFAHLFKSDEQFIGELPSGATVILEGAQGALLDPLHGFQPHVTKTDPTFRAAIEFVKKTGMDEAKVTRVGVLRAYATRHGAGPFVTHDRRLTTRIPDKHNCTNPWQGKFRLGHFDLLMARYGVAVSGAPPDVLALTSLDQLSGSQAKICTAYKYAGDANPNELREYFEFRGDYISALKVVERPSPGRQQRLSELLFGCRPAEFKRFRAWEDGAARSLSELPDAARAYIDFIQDELGVRVGIVSLGATAGSKFFV